MSVNNSPVENPVASEFLMNFAVMNLHGRFTKIQKNANRMNRKKALNKKRAHQMRIDLRWLRTGLSNFKACFSEGDYLTFKETLKAYNDPLAMLREMDVFRIELARLMEQSFTHSIFQGLLRLADLAVYQRQNLLKDFITENESFLQSESWLFLNEFLNKSNVKVDFASNKKEMVSFIQEVVRQRVDELMVVQECLLEDKPTLNFHEMRIKLKGLRYTLEDFNRVTDKHFEPQLKELRPIQECMGEIHDRQMWLNAVEIFFQEIDSAGMTATDREIFLNTLLLLKQQWELEMLDGYHAFKKLWQYLERDAFWDGLKQGSAVLETNIGQNNEAIQSPA